MQSPSSDANSMMQLLQRDFLYNLSLLRERDAELERYDLEVVVLREELEKRDAACHDMRRAWEEREAQEAADRPRVATLQARLADHEKRQRELREELGRKASELHGAAQELEALRAFKEEGQTTVVKAQQLAAERQQELASVRNELGLRLYAAQQELGEAEEGWRNALHEERAQLEARLKAGRTEAARQCGAMQEQAERLHAELANAKRSAEEAHDELRALRDAQASEALRAQRQRAELQRAAAAAEERGQEVHRLGKKLEAAELAARQLQAEASLRLEQQAERFEAQRNEAARVITEREAEARRAAEEEARGRVDAAEGAAAEASSLAEQLAHRLHQASEALKQAEEKARRMGMRAEQLHVEKNALQREMSSLRSEAGSSREKAELMATMLKQRTDFIGEFQAAAAEREQQLGAHHGEQQRLRDLDAQQALAREAERAAAATRELEAVRQLHADAQAACTRLQQRVLALEGGGGGGNAPPTVATAARGRSRLADARRADVATPATQQPGGSADDDDRASLFLERGV